ncbi:VOC family protein [Calothrix sp. PCC 7507]|uniref:VOC family protein n=1 Tax=Calothrix sp. PCC 7507 TaxID=99598 RepID=UPI00029F2788|nr:VOC family protein [Calothrix sp. PCC 7507]AFY32753.1 Glyoxalase/bleomycin resistance protein/dioxygenase [Calothrix sp. PCC 7507]
MTLQAVHHIQVTYPPEAEDATHLFYSQVLGLTEIPRPEVIQNDPGVWYNLGSIELHLSQEKNTNNHATRRHICFQVDHLQAYEEYLKAHGVEIIPDQLPIPGFKRFFLRDPAGNRIEITEITNNFPVKFTADDLSLNRPSAVVS